MKNLVGQTFKKLTVISFKETLVDKGNRRREYWLCKCDCGNEAIVEKWALLRKAGMISCGCYKRSQLGIASIKHGLSFKVPEFNVWRNMKRRCYDKSIEKYKNYGARGIAVCAEWIDKQNGFTNFLNDMGKRPSSKHSIEREDVNGQYCPENCSWIPMADQQKNTTRSRFLEYKGERKILADWARELKRPATSISKMLKDNTFPQIVEWLRQKPFAA